MATLKDAARKGRLGDTRLGHLSNGDRVFPVEHVDEHTGKQIDMFMRKHGLDPGRFTVGHKANRKNPHTRLPEFESSGESNGGDGNGGNGGGGGGGGGEGTGGGSSPGPGGPTGTGDNDNAGSSAAAAQGGATPGSVSGGTPDHEASDVSSPGNNPTGVAGPGGTPGSPTADALASAPEQSLPGISIDRAGPLAGLASAVGLGFLNDKVETLANLGFGLIGGVPSLANTAASQVGKTTSQTTTNPGEITQGAPNTTGPSLGKGVSAAVGAIGDAFSGSGGLAGTGGTGPSPTGGAGGGEGIAGLPSMGTSLAQSIGPTSSPAAGSALAGGLGASASPVAGGGGGLPTNLGGGIGLPLTDMLFNTYRL